jgi:c-di-GMP-binding flagellar brake protein YcgR
MYAINLSWEQTNDILLWAVESKTHMRITVRLAREWNEVPSEFICGELLKTLTVTKFPTPWTDKMLTGQLLPCSFRRGHRKYLFVSAILDQTSVIIDGQPREAYVLSWPEGVQQVQRRLYFRASVPQEMKLTAKIWNSVAAIDSAPAESPLCIGRILDISAGGTQVQLPSPDALTIDKSYLMEIELPKPEQPVLVLAQVRRIDAIAGSGEYRYGIQFLSLDHTPRGQETLLRLARFTNYLRSLQPTQNVNEEQ